MIETVIVQSALATRGKLAILASPSFVDPRYSKRSGFSLLRPIQDCDPKDERVSGVAE